MPKKTILALLSIFILCGCEKIETPPSVITIDKIKITAADFEDAFKNSPYATEDTGASRAEFLNNYISRLLVLKEAEKAGLDKDPRFLKNVEFFWQQSLIKMMLDSKIKELSINNTVTEGEIGAYYDLHREADYKDKDLPSVYDGIKWILVNEKQREAMNAWLENVKKSSKVEVNYKLLKLSE